MLELRGITKSYYVGENVVHALNGVSVNFRNNEFVAVLGQSGSGKTTLLNIVGGLDRYERGDLVINGRSTIEYGDKDWDSYRNHSIGFVFQSYNLIPHQSVLSNVELALTLSGVSKSERRKRAKEVLDKVGLGDQLNKKPNQMSGGQMQRVAIARALVNNPDILLADEPTGALDSETSVQIMELISEIARDRLVIMVTHNPELADSYANRIISLKDGVIIDDSNPYTDEQCEADQAELPPPHKAAKKKKNGEKTSMSMGTALSLSFNNLLTKKGRTLLTSFAGSIGIIGIALILSLSNGMQAYIDSIEKDTLSSYPLTIESESVDVSTIFEDMTADSGKMDETEREKDKIYRNDMLSSVASNMTVKTTENDLAHFMNYLKTNKELEKLTSDIKYGFNVDLQVYKADTSDGVYRVEPSQLGDMMGSMAGEMGGMDLWSELVGDEDLLNTQYEMLSGKWPQNTNELVLFVDKNNEISDYALYALGLADINELTQALEQQSSQEETTVSGKEETTQPEEEQLETYEYADFLNLTFKLVLNTDIYQKNSDGVWEDKSDDEAYMKNVVSAGKELKIVGIARPQDETKSVGVSMGGTIGYMSDMTTELVKEINASTIVKEQKAKPDVDVFTGLKFKPTEKEKATEEESTTAKATGSFQKPTVGFLEKTSAAPQVTPVAESFTMPEGVETMTEDEIYAFIDENYKGDDIDSKKEMVRLVLKDIRTTSERKTLAAELDKALEGTGSEVTGDQICTMLSLMDKDTKLQYMTLLVRAAVDGENIEIPSAVPSKPSDEKTTSAGGGKTEPVEEPKEQFSTSTLEDNLITLGAADPETPDTISIYPLNFEAKTRIKEIIDEYNAEQRANGTEEYVIGYTDLVDLIMSSVTKIINLVTYALVAFVAISLIVSSIMIGVITYISVLERTKEIGILRSIGASKKDISHVFNSETIIIGLVSGLMGILLSLLLLVPINAIIKIAADIANLAVMPVYGGISLVVISVLLTVIAGLIPSRVAAKKDPVIALRTE